MVTKSSLDNSRARTIAGTASPAQARIAAADGRSGRDFTTAIFGLKWWARQGLNL
jgi:hypothetical protein